VKNIIGASLVGATLCIASPQVRAAPNETPPAASALQPVPQTGARADSIRRQLQHVTLPPGFAISLYAIVPEARALAVGPHGSVTFVGTRKDRVYALVDRTHRGVADSVTPFAPNIAKKLPNGVCFSGDGVLYTIEQNRVLAYPAAESSAEDPDVAATVVVAQGGLIPPRFESLNHSARYCRVGPDGKLYIAIGQPYNVPPADVWPMLRAAGLGAIVRMNRDGTGREIYAYGIRNSVGLDFNPTDTTLWFTDNQVDGMGDDIPPGELDHATELGEDFGFPYYGGGHTRTKEYLRQTPPPDLVFPTVEETAHAADLGMSFYVGTMFPRTYRGAIFSAQHGSWNRSVRVGARIMVTFVHPDGDVTQEPFAEGWLDPKGRYLGRPVDVQQLHDGSLLVSDDFAGAVYRITYHEPARTALVQARERDPNVARSMFTKPRFPEPSGGATTKI
jgi:glucose/arabinose dehydrogenase